MCARSVYNLSHGGECDLKQHTKTEGHKTNVRTQSNSKNLTSYFSSQTTSTFHQDIVTAVELDFVFHMVKHNLIYASMDCSNILISHVLKDSKIASGISCGRTKGEYLVKDVLGPKCLQDVVPSLCPTTATSQLLRVQAI